MKRLLLTIATFFIINLAYSSCTAGGEIALRHLSGNNYIIKITGYKDCSSSFVFPNQLPVSFQCVGNNAYSFVYNVNMNLSLSQQVIDFCSSGYSSCNGGNNYGIQKYVYIDTIMILVPGQNWKITTTINCRVLANNVSPTQCYHIALHANLDLTNQTANSLPEFKYAPVFLTVAGNQEIIDNYAIDDENDSLVYKLIPARTDTNSLTGICDYINGYNFQNPINLNSPASLNSNTGELLIQPIWGTYFYTIKVEQWRRINNIATLTGYTMRDIATKVIGITSNIPELSGINPLSTSYDSLDTIYEYEACIGDTLSFNIYGHDKDTFPMYGGNGPILFTISSDFGIANAQYTVVNDSTDSAYVHFYWVPTLSDLGVNVFRLKTHDYACPYIFSNIYKYKIIVKDKIYANLGNDTIISFGTQYQINSNITQNATNINWFLDGNLLNTNPLNLNLQLNTSTLSGGLHEVVVTASDSITNNCPANDTLHFTIFYTGFSENENPCNFNIIPNPSNGNFKIQLTASEPSISMIEIYDIKGQMVYQSVCKIEKGLNIIQISDLEEIEKGIYLLILNSKNQKITRKLIFL